MVRGWPFVLLVAGACGGKDGADPEPGPEPSIEGTPVSTFETTSCSTSDVLALSIQIANEVNCMMPGQLVEFEEGNGIVFESSAVLPYLGDDARTDLYAAVA